MKKSLVVLLIFVFMFTLAASVSAAEEIKVIIDGKPQAFDVAPQNLGGRILVPLRAIFEEMGATIQWDDATQTVTATKDDTVVVLTIGDTSPTVNGQVVSLDQSGILVDGRTLAPLRFVAEAFDGMVDWDVANNTARISRPHVGTGGTYANALIGFSIDFPESWDGKFGTAYLEYEREDGMARMINIFHLATREEFGAGLLHGPGWIFSVGRVPGEHYTAEEPPVMAGWCPILAQTGGYTYFASTPSGVEYNEEEGSLTAAEYQAMSALIESILESFRLLE